MQSLIALALFSDWGPYKLGVSAMAENEYYYSKRQEDCIHVRH